VAGSSPKVTFHKPKENYQTAMAHFDKSDPYLLNGKIET